MNTNPSHLSDPTEFRVLFLFYIFRSLANPVFSSPLPRAHSKPTLMSSHGALYTAFKDGNAELVAEMLTKTRDRWQDQLQPSLFVSVSHCYYHIVDLLLSYGAKMDASTFRAVAHKEDARIFDEFLKHGFDINSTEFEEPILRFV